MSLHDRISGMWLPLNRLRTEVTVVGGSVAGAAAAIACRQRGLTTSLLEPQPEPRPAPGETLHPAMQPLFRALGVEDEIRAAGFMRHPGYRISSRNGTSTHFYGSDAGGEWRGYQADRAILHAILLRRAEACGAMVHRGERATYPVLSGSTISGVKTMDRTYPCRFVLDATGHVHWLAHHLHLTVLEMSPRLTAQFGWATAAARSETGDKLIPEFAMRDGAWDWIAPVGNGLHAWVHLDLDRGRQRMRPRPNEAHARNMEERTPARHAGARDVTWRITQPCAGPGYFLLGDAAFVLDPASSHGVLFAAMSGIAVADALVAILKRPQDSERVQAAYSAWVGEWFCRDAAALISLYAGMENPPAWLDSAAQAVRYMAMSPFERAMSRSTS